MIIEWNNQMGLGFLKPPSENKIEFVPSPAPIPYIIYKD